MAEFVINGFKAIEIEKQHGKMKVAVELAILNDALELVRPVLV